ncbi:S-layer homology domain-containing protein [Paenibacillus agaridevorans]|uniref:S-layer homology domain-containing protein n=1 Tax=Paenibacillus agaridevorans TaxID=171404 RepID=UPI001BE496F2|nr:S-layer homology domain-containing protein [Paenibacillus agaridevorans]
MKKLCSMFTAIVLLLSLFDFGLFIPKAHAAELATPNIKVYDSGDVSNGAGWWFRDQAIAVNGVDKKEGAGSIEVVGGGVIDLNKSGAVKFDASDYATGYLQLWVYTSDVSKLAGKAGSIEIGSGGVYGTAQYYWDFGTQVSPYLRNGWNHLSLPLSEAHIPAGGSAPDLSKLDWFRFFVIAGSSEYLTTRLDNIVFSDTSFLMPRSFNNADATEGWWENNGRQLDLVDKKEGAAALQSTGIDEQRFVYFLGDQSIAAGVTEDAGYIQFWFYVSDLLRFNGTGQVEVGSSPWGEDGYTWSIADNVVPQLTLTEGWNLVHLKLSDGIKRGDPDLSKVNWFRILMQGTDAFTTKLDDVRFTNGEAEIPVVEPEPEPEPELGPVMDLFYTGFEEHDPQPQYVNTYAWLPSNVTNYVNEPIQAVGYEGDKVLTISGVDAGNPSFVYFKSFDVNINVAPNAVLEYYIKPLNALGRFTGIDLEFSDGSSLRESGAVDQNGVSMHPGAVRNTALNTWSLVKSDIGVSNSGKTIKRIWVAYDHAEDSGTFDSYIDNIKISGSKVSSYVGRLGAEVMDLTLDSEDLPIASLNVMAFGAKADGVTDDGPAFRTAMNKASKDGGAVVFVPAGRYKIEGTLNIPKGVTLRGDWQNPESSAAAAGTILQAYAGRGNENSASFITTDDNSVVRNLTIWYPEQDDIDNIQPFPWTIEGIGVWGPNVYNVTLINSYKGIHAEKDRHSVHYLKNIYGTPLKLGIAIDNTWDIGREHNVNFAPRYWAESGLAGSPSDSDILSYLQSNATAIVIERSDWEYMYNLYFEGYQTGILMKSDYAGPFNGQIWGLVIEKGITGIRADVVNDIGVMVSNSSIRTVGPAVVTGNDFKNPQSLNFNTTIFASEDEQAIVQQDGTGVINVVHSTFESWGASKSAIDLAKGTLIATGNRFMQDDQSIHLAPRVTSASISENEYANASPILNESFGDIKLGAETTGKATIVPIPLRDTPAAKPQPKPTSDYVVNVKSEPFWATGDGETDDTEAFQDALDAAEAEGGGTVYVPAGRYLIEGHLVIPANTELRGVNDGPRHFGAAPKGTVLLATGSANDTNGDPFITLLDDAGVNGLSIFYPNQSYSNMTRYPATIEGAGQGAYAVFLTLPNSYTGIVFKQKDYYLKYGRITGLSKGIVIDGVSEGGYLEDSQNTMGDWQDGAREDNAPPSDLWTVTPSFPQSTNIEINNSSNVILLGNFVFGFGHPLVISGNSSNIDAYGYGADNSGHVVRLTGSGSNINFYNLQAVSIGTGLFDNVAGRHLNKYYIYTSPTFTGELNIYNATAWATKAGNLFEGDGTVHIEQWTAREGGMKVAGGTLNLQSSFFHMFPAQVEVLAGANATIKANGGSKEFVVNQAVGSVVQSELNIMVGDVVIVPEPEAKRVANQTVTLDGNLEALVWKTAHWNDFNLYSVKKLDDPTNISGKFAFIHDDEYLYFTFNATDNYMYNKRPIASIWDADGVEMYFNFNNTSEGNKGFYQVVVGPDYLDADGVQANQAGFNVYRMENDQAYTKAMNAIEAYGAQTEKGWIVQVKLKISEFDGAAPYFSASGGGIPFELTVIDRDGADGGTWNQYYSNLSSITIPANTDTNNPTHPEGPTNPSNPGNTGNPSNSENPGNEPEESVDPKHNFTDTAGHWAEKLISKAAADGIVFGYPSGDFMPDKTASRAEFVVMLMRVLKLHDVGDISMFNDSKQIAAWAAPAIKAAVSAGLIYGYADGSFKPGGQITRAEMAVIVARSLGVSMDSVIATGYKDDADIPTWAKTAVAALRESGIMQGQGANVFNPNATATRAEVVAVLLRIMEQS